VNGTRGLIIATAAAFIVGCSAGLMGGILFTHFVGPRFHGGPRMLFFERHGGPDRSGMPGGPERWIPWLERELNLSPAQHERIVAVLDRARHEQIAERESLHVWIGRELTPEQREKWKQMEQGFERSRRGRWERGPMSPDRP
jgi:hypothetical protein